jgi:hypothetical protein
LFSFPAGTEMVHFPALASVTYGFSHGNPGMSRDGLPHSEICGSKLVCSSPQLIAAYHVLHRLLAPRHSPCALSSLTIRTRDCRLWAPDSGLPAPGKLSPEVRSPKPVAHTRQLSKYTLRVCGRKTTVAEYSVVKELLRLVPAGLKPRLHVLQPIFPSPRRICDSAPASPGRLAH